MVFVSLCQSSTKDIALCREGLFKLLWIQLLECVVEKYTGMNRNLQSRQNADEKHGVKERCLIQVYLYSTFKTNAFQCQLHKSLDNSKMYWAQIQFTIKSSTEWNLPGCALLCGEHGDIVWSPSWVWQPLTAVYTLHWFDYSINEMYKMNLLWQTGEIEYWMWGCLRLLTCIHGSEHVSV